MLEILLFLAVLLGIITVLGHGLWLAIAAIFRALADDSHDVFAAERADTEAFRRVVLRLRDAGKLEPDEMRRILNLVEPQAKPQPAEQEPIAAPVRVVPPDARQAGSLPPAPAAAAEPAAPLSRRRRENVIAPQPHPLDQIGSPAAAPPAPRSYAGDARRATAHVMRSFLAEHNIRWGELVAGLLIVVCSVGLVISLWNTLEETHRLLPSLVFMLGTAGVEGAGLYTLTRWRLRTTSRAMLVIASLLVPLNVVAGIALARSGDAPLSLADPVTAVTVMLSAAAYGVLMWWAGRAVLGRAPWRWTVAVVGPAVALVFFPMLIAEFGADAGWAAGLPALCVIGALMTETRGRARIGSGRAARTTMLASVAIYAAAVAVVFLGLQIHQLSGALVAIATAVMPAAIFVAGWALWLHAAAAGPSATWIRLTAVSIALVCSLVVISVFPPALAELRYALGWCVVVAVSAILTAMAHRQAVLLYGAAAATGLAIVLIVPQVAYAPEWDGAAGLVQRITGGPAGVAWVSYAVALAAVGWLTRAAWKAAGRVLTRSAVVAGGVGVASAALVSLGPREWSEPVPIVISWMLLAVAAGLVLLAAGRRPQVSSAASVLVVAFWLSLFRGAEAWPGGEVASWVNLIGGAAIAALSTLSAAVLVGSLLRPAWSDRLAGWGGPQLFAWSAGVGAVASVAAALQFAWAPRYAVMCWSVIAAWGIAIGLVRRRVPVLVAGQLAGLVALLALGQTQTWWTLLPESWSRSQTAWQVVAVVLIYAVAWALVRCVLRRTSFEGPTYEWQTDGGQGNGWGCLADQPLGCIALSGGILAAAWSMATAVRHSLQWFAGISHDMPAIQPPLPSAGWLGAAIGAGVAWVVLTCLNRDARVTGEAAGEGEAAESVKAAAVLGVLFAAAMAAITGLVLFETPWNVAVGAIAAVVTSLMLLVGVRLATGAGWLDDQEESALWPVCFFNALAWAGPVIATWSFVVLAPHRGLSTGTSTAMAAVEGALWLLWAVVGVLLWSWYRCPRTDQFAIVSIAMAAVVGYAGTLGRPDGNGIIQWLAVAGTTLWALAVGIAEAKRAGLTHALKRLGRVAGESQFAPQPSDAVERFVGRSLDVEGGAPAQAVPRLAAGPALAAGVIAAAIALVAAKTLLQLPPHDLFGALPGPAASNVGILFWLVSLVGAWMMVVEGGGPFRQLPRESLSAWILAVASGWTALVALRFFAWSDLAIPWGCIGSLSCGVCRAFTGAPFGFTPSAPPPTVAASGRSRWHPRRILRCGSIVGCWQSPPSVRPWSQCSMWRNRWGMSDRCIPFPFPGGRLEKSLWRSPRRSPPGGQYCGLTDRARRLRRSC